MGRTCKLVDNGTVFIHRDTSLLVMTLYETRMPCCSWLYHP